MTTGRLKLIDIKREQVRMAAESVLRGRLGCGSCAVKATCSVLDQPLEEIADSIVEYDRLVYQCTYDALDGLLRGIPEKQKMHNNGIRWYAKYKEVEELLNDGSISEKCKQLNGEQLNINIEEYLKNQ